MQQMTWRAEDELLDRVRARAMTTGRSMNEYVTWVLDAVTDPTRAGSEEEALRERLSLAGVLAPRGTPRTRPDADAVSDARRRAGRGTPLSEIVAADRG